MSQKEYSEQLQEMQISPEVCSFCMQAEKKLAERKIKPSKEETIALLRSLQEEREKERRENENRREGGTG